VQRTIDVDSVLDAGRFRGLPLLVLVCASTILILDGLDIQVIAFAAPALTAEFGIERQDLGPVLAASLLGMAIGAFSLGAAGDRYGRRPTILVGGVLFAVATLLASTSSSLAQLTFWRLVTGIGLGGVLPNAAALIAEFAPPRWRSQSIAASIVGVPVGGMIGAAIAAELIPAYGWRAMFVVGGVLPLVAIAIMYFVLPESPRFLAARGGRNRELAGLLNRCVGAATYSEQDAFTLNQTAGGRGNGLRALFSAPFVRDTVALWIIFITNLFSVYAFFSWTPVILTSLGLELATAVRGSLVFNLAGVLGTLVSSWIISRQGSRWPLAAQGVLGIVALLWLASLAAASAAANAAPDLATLMSGIALAGLGITALQVGAYTVAAHVYPTECRSSGVGWAAGIGRLGGIASAFSSGFILTKFGGAGFFVAIAAIVALTFIGVLLIRRHIPPLAKE
jgi:AAHS family 4-hydroxybenzoate transporter-like MFS transporter